MESHQRSFYKNRLLWYVCAVLLFVGGTTTAFAHYIQESYLNITLNDNGYIVEIQTMDKIVKDVLDKYEITLGPGDEVTPGLDETIEKNTEIQILRAFEVTVAADDKSKSLYLTGGTIEDALNKAYIVLGRMDFVNYPLTQEVLPGDYIKVTRVKEEILTEKEIIPYKAITKENDELDKGKEKLVQEGKEGEKEREILVVYYDGVENNRKIVEEKITREPMDRIVAKGTYEAPVASRGDAKRETSSSSKTNKSAQSKTQTTKKSTSNTKAKSTGSKSGSKTATSYLGSGTYTFQATAYIRTGNRTNSGKWPKEGMIAVDKRLIPLGTKVYVEFPGKWARLNGYYVAEDTGGAIKGQIIDVFMDTNDESKANNFGRLKNVKVTIP